MVNHPNRSIRKKKAAVGTVSSGTHDHDYSGLLRGVAAWFGAITPGYTKLFMTDARGLNDLYLDSLPGERQVHNCHACRRFIETYGALVTINENGETSPVMWAPSAVPEFYEPAFAALHARVKKARVTSVFLTKQSIWGNPITGNFQHIAVQPPDALIYRERALTAGQAMAAMRENFGTVSRALAELSAPMLDQALRLLRAEALNRSERFTAPAEWLRKLHDRPKGRRGENVLWRAIASAPEGYCHPRASVLGPLLEDIAAGLPFETIKARFDAKMAPHLYQRPQAAPTTGNITAAESLVAKLGLARSLERRFARLDELETIWTPRADSPRSHAGGVFGHLKAKGQPTAPLVDLPLVTITWEKFARTVLPEATRLEFLVPYGASRFMAMTTAVHADAPPVLRWDREDARNPVAWYVYTSGSPAAQWGLSPGSWVRVNAIAPLPPLWGPHPKPHLGDGLMLVLDGAVDSGKGHNGLFPESLNDELRQIRSTIEAYCGSAEVGGQDQASACGFDMRKTANKGRAQATLRALVGGGWMAYHVDRWD